MAKHSDILKGTKGMTIGLDLGDRTSSISVMDGEGEILERTTVKTTSAGLAGYFGGRLACRVTLEAGTHSPWVQRLLRSLGHDAVVLNPHRLRMIAESFAKSDENDADILADLGRMGFRTLRGVEHRSAQAQADMEVLRARGLLVEQRKALHLHLNGVVKANGGRLVGCSVRSKSAKVMPQVPELLRAALAPIEEQIERLSVQIAKYEEEIKRLIKESYPAAQGLQQIPGVGPITALTYVLVIGAPERFQKSRQVGAYLGLVPRRRQSGGRDPELGITKAGDSELRRLLVQCAHYILNHEGAAGNLRTWGLARTGGSKSVYKRTVVAVARKLAVLMHALWKNEAAYEPNRGKEGEELQAA